LHKPFGSVIINSIMASSIMAFDKIKLVIIAFSITINNIIALCILPYIAMSFSKMK